MSHARSERPTDGPSRRSSRIVHRCGSSVLTLHADGLIRSLHAKQRVHQQQDRCRHRRQLGHRAAHRHPDRRARRRRDPDLQHQSRGGARRPSRPSRTAEARPSPSQLDVGDSETFDAFAAARGRRALRPLAAHLVRLPRQQRRLRADVDVRRHHGGALRPVPPGHPQGPVLPHPEAAAPPRRRRRDRQHDQQLGAAHRTGGRLLRVRQHEGRPHGAHAIPGQGAQRARDPRQLGRPRSDPDPDLADDAFERFPEVIPPLVARTALGRLGDGDDIGKVIAALLSDECGWITGENIEASGGFNL